MTVEDMETVAGYGPVTTAYDYAECCGSEVLRHDTINEAIQYRLEQRQPEDWPRVIEVTLHVRQRTEDDDVERYTEWLLDKLGEELDEDEKYSDPEDTRFRKLGKSTAAAAKVFVREALSNVEIYYCTELSETLQVDVAEWVAANRPDWEET